MLIIEIMTIVPVMIISRSNPENRKLNSGCVNCKRKKNPNNNDNVDDKAENCNNESKSLVIVIDAELK